MAKWGEGDPRWIVEERPDATNVNNWHWTEKNAGPWSVERIKELFKGVPVKTDLADIQFTEIDKCEGEASANNRKGKLIFFYEWDLSIKWTGKLKNGSKSYSGKVKIPNLSEENDVSELDIKVSVKDSDEEGDKLKEIMLKSCKDVVRHQLTKYISSLKEEFSKGMILPKKDEVKPDAVKNLSSGFNKKISMTPVVSENNKQIGLKLDVTTINITQQFQCRAQEFYDALTKIEMVTAFTRAHVKMDASKGGKFELFNGNIVGQFDELVPGKKIVQQWRYKQWPEGHYSTVTFNINEKSDHTEVNVVQSGVPTGEAEVTKENWQRYYWDSMKRAFGFGAFIV
ncbi:activator of 90 kDa heat shock protein ATPase homolog 1 [Tribolium castaneum]|uniref:Activator of 90 kDa heat shock protein ATPase homolog 1-like Protein n=1 Tax=Tribolium castaneum TaxID=7070 RepID=D6WCK9_TRICA|nr:PREDICTED: activator of 90 kDa heat shock protein ATPase homolog 1 [Tribolium castaneum]XP_972738.1 PREDICTED: activator of 90 kDa heat shock protein ATPase homolog 1 [Tribolium castaneum]EEZ99044.1 Activator of 90 kDa heat shock protein ATPase homolog 1-like Protein [Tribolium castaneum]|eukprot:XP_008200903.1 PREDICTED: activator of 90 kDa heat shock protein ATPase homolog 1 [Tribolium castaneum]